MQDLQNLAQDLTEPNPNSAGAVKLHQCLRGKIIRSLIALLKAAAKTLNQNYEIQINLLDAIDPQKHFSIHLYFYYFSLLEAMNLNDFAKTIHINEELLDHLNNKNSYSNQLKIKFEYEDDVEKNLLFEILNLDKPCTISKISPEQSQLYNKLIQQSLQIIEEADVEMKSEIDDHISLLLIADGDFATFAGSSIKYFGGLPIRIPNTPIDPVLYFFDIIIHEDAHQHLNLLTTFDPMILNKKDELYYSPAKGTKRPMKGIFHAHFVFYRLVRMYLLANHFFTDQLIAINKNEFNRYQERIAELPWVYHERLKAYMIKFLQCEKVIKDFAQFTTTGKQLFEQMSKNFQQLTSSFIRAES